MFSTSNRTIFYFLLPILILSFISRAACKLSLTSETAYNENVERIVSMVKAQRINNFHSAIRNFYPVPTHSQTLHQSQIALYHQKRSSDQRTPINVLDIQRQISTGLSGELCRTDTDCSSPRRCIDVQSSTPCTGSSGCFCLPTNPSDFYCSCTNLNCLEGDVCSVVGSDTVCVSPVRDYPLIDCGGPGNFTLQSCSEDSDCAGLRRCVSRMPAGAPCSGSNCFCFPIKSEDSECSCRNPHCLEGDACKDLGEKFSLCIGASADLPPIACDQEMKFTGESCRTDSECTGPRFCFDDDLSPCSINSSSCICRPSAERDLACGCPDTRCIVGDVCSEIEGNMTACRSSNLELTRAICNSSIGKGPGERCRTQSECKPFHSCVDLSNDIRQCNNSTECICVEDNVDDRRQFTQEPCEENKDCAGLRSCQNSGPSPCDGGKNCTCSPVDIDDLDCSCENPNCLEGDICAFGEIRSFCVSGTIGLPELKCPISLPLPSESTSEVDTPAAAIDSSPEVSPGTTAAPSPQSNVCVDARALSDMAKPELVYQEHVLAKVLCDQSGSCATSGHMVEYMGSGMMMKSYCMIAGCVERVMEVNSPRYRKGIRVRSKTAGLEYTAFAARYGSRAEESFLATAIRFRL